MPKRKRRGVVVFVLAVLTGLGSLGVTDDATSRSGTSYRVGWLGSPVYAGSPAQTGVGVLPRRGSATVTPPDWLEPQGLSIVELVGEVPEDYLQGMILSYGDADGIIVYRAGSRTGDTVVVRATIYSRVHPADWAPNDRVTTFGCLGQKPIYDHKGSVVPASTLRVYDNAGQDVTSLIKYLYATNEGMQQPLANSRAYDRYPVDDYGQGKTYPLPMGPDGLNIPANSGCKIQMPGVDYYPLTGVFTLKFDRSVSASVVGSQQATFPSYIGPGSVGIFAPLMNQLRSRYADRDTLIPLSIPQGANYLLVRFPAMPADAYADQMDGPPYLNANRPSSGTYRARLDLPLGVDLTYSAAFPVDTTWRDSDQVPGAFFLPLLTQPGGLAPLEYVIPSGIAYNSCFTQGNCPDYLLQQIHDAQMSLEIFYLAVTEPSGDGHWVALRMAGPAWRPGGPASLPVRPGPLARFPPASDILYFPLVLRNGGAPCGWFDSLGRMLYYRDGSR